MQIAALVTVISVALLLVAEYRESQTGRWLVKPVASSGFVAFAIAAGAVETSYGIAVLVALVLSWWGDLLLIPKSRKVFMAGILAFLLGHVGFGVAFVVVGVSWPATALAALGMSVPAVIVGRWILGRAPPELKGAVFAYILVISTMVALAIGAVAAGGDYRMLVAAVVFYLSDLAVARQRFIHKSFVNRAWGLPFYYGAQLIFGVTVAAWTASSVGA